MMKNSAKGSLLDVLNKKLSENIMWNLYKLYMKFYITMISLV